MSKSYAFLLLILTLTGCTVDVHGLKRQETSRSPATASDSSEAGAPEADAGAPEADAGAPEADAGAPEADASSRDECPADPSKLEPGECGCGRLDVDADGDGVADCLDGCPADPAKTEAGSCPCGVPESDCADAGTDACPDSAEDEAGGGCSNTPPTVRFVRPASRRVQAGQLGIQVAASDGDGRIVGVTLYINGVEVSRDTEAPYQWGTSDQALTQYGAGFYRLVAIAEDDQGARARATKFITIIP